MRASVHVCVSVCARVEHGHSKEALDTKNASVEAREEHTLNSNRELRGFLLA